MSIETTKFIKQLSLNDIIMYTDGACKGNPGPMGIGVLLIYGENEKEISEYIGYGTNNIAELTAIKRGLEEIKNQNIPLTIYTDSKYAQQILLNQWKPTKNVELINSIKQSLKKFKSYKILHVYGHQKNNGYNDRVDKLAVNGSKLY